MDKLVKKKKKICSCFDLARSSHILCKFRRRSSESLLRQPALVVTVRSNQSCWVCIRAAEAAEKRQIFRPIFCLLDQVSDKHMMASSGRYLSERHADYSGCDPAGTL